MKRQTCLYYFFRTERNIKINDLSWLKLMHLAYNANIYFKKYDSNKVIHSSCKKFYPIILYLSGTT